MRCLRVIVKDAAGVTAVAPGRTSLVAVQV